MKPEDIQTFFNLPWSTLVILACGYIGYYITNIGLKVPNNSIDILFSILVFGMCSIIFYKFVDNIDRNYILSTVAAVIASVIISLIWRLIFKRIFYKILNIFKIQPLDNQDKALPNILIKQSKVTSLLVYIKNDIVLKSYEIEQFNDKPMGPFTISSDGSVLMYVTDSKINDKWLKNKDVIINDKANEITYIPKSEIDRISFVVE